MKHTCPVCGFAGLTDAPRDYEICPCCGTEFGLDDSERGHDELRDDWIARGAPWFSKETRQPAGWNAMEQLADAGRLPYSLEAEASSAATIPPILDVRKTKPLYRRG